MKCCLLLACLLAVAAADTAANQRQTAQTRAGDITADLYMTLRNIAFPSHKLTDTTSVDGRFLMLTPGKILNFLDYYPGAEYTQFVNNPNANTPETVVPPRVMERWFDLADNIPSYNPMNAQDTGKSLANIYTAILYQSKLLGLESKTASERAMLQQATDYLNEMLIDPENTNATVPRLTLYERYRDLYNDRKLDMEDIIDKKRRSVGYIDYELWFQRNYPSLQAKVESAYTRWLIFGDKENVELYITYMDTGSAGKQLEQARMALRAAGVTSLDRTRTIYPVSFEPSDWYHYLLPEENLPSADQLQLMYGKLQSKISAIDAMADALNNSNDTVTEIFNNLKGSYEAAESTVTENTTALMESQIQCLRNSNTNPDCEDYDRRRSDTIAALAKQADEFSTYQYSSYFKSPQKFLDHLIREKASLQAQIEKVQSQLDLSSPYLGGFLDDSKLAVANLSLATRDRQWLQFEYDSSSFSKDESRESTSKRVSASFSGGFWFFRASASYSSTKNTEDYNQKLAKSNLRAKGEMLRVNIKRPWFKPELFEIPDITFSESHDGLNSFVSPGQSFSEDQFYDELTNRANTYKLPEYTTGFLLARNIELEFSGLDSETVTSTMNEMSRSSGSGGFLFFRASASVTKTKQTSHVRVARTGSGMKIKIPGAQVIGYYTRVMPRFPVNQ